jgi:predicted nucleic acid-binding protein
MKVVSNTSPLRYLIAVGQSDLIANIFGHVLIPREVEKELTHPAALPVVRQWMKQRPSWIEVHDLAGPPEHALLQRLDLGEAEAIQLAVDIKADFLIIDERLGRHAATERSIIIVGILGILLESYRGGTIRQPMQTLAELQNAGFRVSRRLVLEFQTQIAQR